MEKCYLYGAGINSASVVRFLGKENVLAIVDSNDDKVGFERAGVEVISYESFKKSYNGEPVLITAYSVADTIYNMLKADGFSRISLCPIIHRGFWDSFEEFVATYSDRRWKLEKDDYFYAAFKEVLTAKGMPFNEAGADFDPWEAFISPPIKERENLKRFKDLYKGKSCFIVGNGPSLRFEDLEKIREKKLISFGSNYIFKSFDKLKWRPTYYVVLDANFAAANMGNLIEHYSDEITFFQAEEYKGKTVPKVNYYTSKTPDKMSFSEDISNKVFSATTVTYDAIQIAMYMGFSTIYLIGVDCSDGSKHFYSNSEIDMTKIENLTQLSQNRWNKVYENWRAGYSEARKVAEKRGVRIINATRGGKLEIFERMDFDEVMKNEV